MPPPDTFQNDTNWEQFSGEACYVKVGATETHMWPVGTNSESGAKDTLSEGEHPVLAVGGRTTADGRPENLTGVVISYESDADIAVLMVCKYIVRQYVANVLTYSGGSAATFEQTPVVGQPVYVDDSDDLSEGVTLSMSPTADHDNDIANPLAGWLFYCQDEYADSGVGGPNASETFDTALPNSLTEQEYCVLLADVTGRGS